MAKKLTRAQKIEVYMCEAFGCMECSVTVEKIDDEAITRIQQQLIRTQQNVGQTPVSSETPAQLSPRSKRRQEDSKFKPPVPFPVRFVDVETMKSDEHARILQIQNEHNYSR